MRPKFLACSFASSILLASLWATPAGARVPNLTPTRRLGSAVAQSLSAPAARGAIAGVLVERGTAPVIALNADRPLAPASLAKLSTTTAALLKFGPQYRFATRVVADGNDDGVVTGNLVLVGGGDPAFVSAAYGRRRYVPQPNDPAPVTVFRSGFATVEQLADAVQAAGVRRVTGGLVVDESLFDSQRTAPGWLPAYQKKGSNEVGNLSAMTVDEGFVDVEQVNVAADPALRAGTLVRAALAARGIAIAGGVSHGLAPKGAKQVAKVMSPTLADLVFYTNRWSVNYGAEMLAKDLGAYFGHGGTTAEGVEIIRQTLTKAGVPVDGFHLTDGSGLSVLDRVTPATIAALIRRALDDQTPAGAAMRDSLPVAGGPGTLLKRLRDAPAAGNLRGKTGLIRGVRGMAGWVTGLDGSVIVYVTLFNDASSAAALTGPIDLIGLALARFPYE